VDSVVLLDLCLAAIAGIRLVVAADLLVEEKMTAQYLVAQTAVEEVALLAGVWVQLAFGSLTSFLDKTRLHQQ